MSEENSPKELLTVDFLQQLFDCTWILADFCRDKRQDGGAESFRPKAGIPQEVLTALVDSNKLLSKALMILNTPDEDYDGEIHEEIIEEVDLEDVLKRQKDAPREVDLD